MALQTLRALFLQHLRLLYSGEHQLSKSLPRILEGLCSREAQRTVQEYQSEAEARCEQMETISKIITENLAGERCGVMDALTRQALALSELRGEERVLDLAVMTNLRQIGHFEKSCFEIVRSFAEVLEESEVIPILDQMLSETERAERGLILLTEDMMDSLTEQKLEERREPEVFRVVPRDIAS